MNEPDAEQIEKLVGELTVDEKCALLVGADFAAVPGCERVGIPGWRVSDGPVGVRGRGMTAGLLLPSSSAMAASWDVCLVEELGVALGREAIDRDVDLVLGPTVNLHRSPRAGRHFEMFSEDPELSARMVVAYVTGLQSQRVGACVKHFVANDQEFERTTIDARVDERTLREVYLRPFEAAVTEAGARSIMAAYNFVNGVHACASSELLLDVLKGEWRFDGVVLSDWDAMKETVGPARHGLDVEMPGPGRWWGGGQLTRAVESGEVHEDSIDDKVRRVLAFLAWRGRLPGESTTEDERSVDRPEHRALVRRAAAAGTVLLKNDGLLPLAPGRSVALIGPGAVETARLGGGSASLTPHPSPTVAEAMTARYDGAVTVAPGVELRRVAPSVPAAWIGPDGVTAELYDGPELAGAPFRVDHLDGPLHAWFASDCPSGVRLGAVRVRLPLVTEAGGRFRIMGAASHRGRLFVDGELVATNEDGFKVMLGLTGGAAEVMLEGGRTYDVVLESTPHDGEGGTGLNYSVVDVGIEAVGGDREDLLAAAERAAAESDVAIVVVGSNSEWESEGHDRTDLVLPAGQDELVRRVLAVNPRTVVLLNCGAPMLLPWLDDVPAALLAWYPGQEGGEAIVDVLLGDAEPGGRMPTTWARAERDTPSFFHYPGEAGVVRYGEELHVGYRWYDARGIEPMLPFGHGGSYTEFVWSEPTVSVAGADVVVDVPVTNVGARRGSDVVQVYVAPREPRVARPPKQLAAFAKVHVDPGRTEVARVIVPERAFARWDVLVHDWVVDPGAYDLVVAASAVDERFHLVHEIGPARVSTGTRLVFPEQGRVLVEEFEVPDPGPAQVLVRTRASLISSGTERTVLHGRYDAGTHWESYGRYPFFPGYSAVGEVVAVGDEVPEFAVGDVVAARGGHASHHVTDAVGCTRIPVGIDVQQATWFAFAKIARMGAQVAEYGLGARVLTVGAGMIGQMSVRWANAAGAQSNVVVDPVPARLALAERGGATATTTAAVSDRDAVLAACDGVQPDYVIDATGNAAVFSAALHLVAFRGRVVLVGNTGAPSQQRLTDDVITRCLTIVGAHDVLSMLASPWDGDRSLHEHFFHLVRTGRFDLDGLVTDVFAPSEADAAYRALDERPAETLGVCFDWT